MHRCLLTLPSPPNRNLIPDEKEKEEALEKFKAEEIFFFFDKLSIHLEGREWFMSGKVGSGPGLGAY